MEMWALWDRPVSRSIRQCGGVLSTWSSTSRSGDIGQPRGPLCLSVWERRSWRPCRFGLGPLVHVGAGGVAQYRMDVVAQPGRGRSSVARAGTNARGAQQFQAVECSDIFGRTDGNFSSSRPV